MVKDSLTPHFMFHSKRHRGGLTSIMGRCRYCAYTWETLPSETVAERAAERMARDHLRDEHEDVPMPADIEERGRPARFE